MSESDFPDMSTIRHATDEAMREVESQKEKLAELSRIWHEESTTVSTKDNLLSVTVDGRGELTELTFNGNRYRSMPPAQLANTIVETINRARAQSMEKVAAVAPEPPVPGLGLDSTGAPPDPQELMNSLLAPMLDKMTEFAPGARSGAERDDTQGVSRDGR